MTCGRPLQRLVGRPRRHRRSGLRRFLACEELILKGRWWLKRSKGGNRQPKTPRRAVVWQVRERVSNPSASRVGVAVRWRTGKVEEEFDGGVEIVHGHHTQDDGVRREPVLVTPKTVVDGQSRAHGKEREISLVHDDATGADVADLKKPVSLALNNLVRKPRGAAR
jgi:hypothetical protein